MVRSARVCVRGAWTLTLDVLTFSRQIVGVRKAIASGLHPKMIQTGSSGSYFVRTYKSEESALAPNEGVVTSSQANAVHEVVAVFKPNDEEPYGDLNPKRVLLRRYLWWAMGRPCLIPSFSYLSEVAASRLDTRLDLGLVPSTRLVKIASETFYYLPSERKQESLREKPGSYQQFLRGYVNASAFLRAHPWPSRPRDLLERDIRAENTAHGRAKARARKGKAPKPTAGRKCMNCIARLSCVGRRTRDENSDDANRDTEESAQTVDETQAFLWTAELIDDFRVELEKLVCFDYLIRNTDRGLDNFMVKIIEPSAEGPSRRTLKLAAIDNSLAFPWTHPAGIRSYPWGWLYLPTDLIGGPFSAETRALFIAHLSSPAWWNQTRIELERLFREDAHFDSKKFEGQMDVLRGQGWNLLESLRSDGEGPLELCAREKQRVKVNAKTFNEDELLSLTGTLHPLTTFARTLIIQSESQSGRAVAAGQLAARPLQIGRTQSARDPELSNGTSLRPTSLPDSAGISSEGARSVAGATNLQHDSDGPESVGNIVESDALGKAYRRGSLGIDVLKEIDKRSPHRKNRPLLRKAVTGSARGQLRRQPSPDGLMSLQDSVREDRGDEGSDAEGAAGSGSAGLAASTASLDASRIVSANKHGRRRMGSVGEPWSIHSALESVDKRRPNVARRIKALVEVSVALQLPHMFDKCRRSDQAPRFLLPLQCLEADRGVAWQTWLGL